MRPFGVQLCATIVLMNRVIAETADLATASLDFASRIDYASTGETLGALVREAIASRPGEFAATRAAIRTRLDQLGGTGSTPGLSARRRPRHDRGLV